MLGLASCGNRTRKAVFLFRSNLIFFGRVKARPADRNFGRGRSAAGLHASLDSFYRTVRDRRQDRSGVTLIPLRLLPRRCPFCGDQTIIGHGKRRKQAHDQQRDWIWIRRGRCPPCRKTFTFLPIWSPPYGHYSSVAGNKHGSPAAKAAAAGNNRAPHERSQSISRSSHVAALGLRRLLSLCATGKQAVAGGRMEHFRAHPPSSPGIGRRPP